MARTDSLNNYLEDLSIAIKEKKGDNTPINASEFDTEIRNLPSGGGTKWNSYFVESTNSNNLKAMIKIFPSIRFNGISCNSMFSDCKDIVSIDLSNFDTSKVTNMRAMFNGCSNLTNLDLSSFDTSNVNDAWGMYQMFQGCSSLISLDIHNFIINETNNLSNMFASCTSLETLNIGFDGSNIVNNMGTMFYNCTSLNNLTFMIDYGKKFTQKSNNYSNYTINISYADLTHDSIIDIFNKLYDLNITYDVANGGTLYTQKLQLGKNINKVSPEEISLVTAKGWTVS